MTSETATTIKTTVDFIKDDPCNGCRYATLIPKHQLDGIFPEDLDA